MKKIFAVYAEVEIKDKPKWLTDFREKYSKPYDFHITLKQPCNIEESEISIIKDKLKRFFKDSKNKGSVEVVFDYLFEEADGSCVMIGFKGENKIYTLQKDLVNFLAEFSDYVEPKTEKYEKSFFPHLTIGDELDPDRYKQAIKDLPDDIEMRGIIKKIVLVVAKEARPEQSLNPDNLTKFVL